MYRGITLVERSPARRYRQGAVLVVAAALTSGVLVPTGPPPESFVSDRFAASTLDPHWQPVRPHGAGAVQLAGDADGQQWLALSVPAGVNHHPWTANQAVRAVQRIPDEDLQLEAGFASLPVTRYQLQGLIVAASETTFLRYEVHHDGAGLRLFAARTVDGNPTVLTDTRLPDELDQIHLRLQRQRDDWTLAWSADRAAWSAAAEFHWPVRVAEVGPYAGNYDAAGNPPAYTALVDYVEDPTGPAPAPPEGAAPAGDDPAPPVVAGVAAHPRPHSARLSWTTDELTTGWVEYGPNPGSGDRSEQTRTGLGHAVTLTGLDPDTAYHYRVVATDQAGHETVTGDGTFTTPAAESTDRFASDEFNAAELAPDWRAVTPLGVGTVGRTGEGGGRLALSVPAGHNHDPWTANHALRAVQRVIDDDLAIEAQFASMPDQRNQMQGLTVGESRLTFLRFGVHQDGSGLRLFGSVTVQGRPTVVTNLGLPELDAIRLRVAREVDDWVLSWSPPDGEWIEVAAFSQRMVLSEVGPFAGTHRAEGDPPAYTALVDYVRDTGSAGTAGPGAGEPPELGDVTVDTRTNHVLLGWTTDRTATTRVEYGPDESYGSTATVPAPGTVHRLQLAELARGTTYHYRVVATDDAGRTARTADRTFTTAATNTGPTIDLWYGTEQVVGGPALTQDWVNLVGNVSDADGVATLSYSVNGGGAQPMQLGPDDRRLQWPGDFNADIPSDQLQPGANPITLTATDQLGRVSSRTVTVTYQPGGELALPYQLTWRTGVSPAEQAQVVDGAWTVTEAGLRTSITGYDRVVAVGDIGWTDYEVTVPITVHELGPAGYTRLSGAPQIGLGLRWQGHSAVDDKQPAWGFYPTGAFAWYRFHEDGARFELVGNEGSPSQFATPGLDLDTAYLLKVRVETVPGGTSYQAKLWPADTAEPGFYELQITEDEGPAAGSVILIAHQLHGTFGTVSVQPL